MLEFKFWALLKSSTTSSISQFPTTYQQWISIFPFKGFQERLYSGIEGYLALPGYQAFHKYYLFNPQNTLSRQYSYSLHLTGKETKSERDW